MTPSGVIANLAFSTTFTYGLAGRPGVLTSVSAGDSASQVYAPPSSVGMQNALTEMFLVDEGAAGEVADVDAAADLPRHLQLTGAGAACCG